MFTMPSKKRKYNARFPAGRIKKIMQTDEEVGKVAQAVPIIIYPIPLTPRTLELFVESLLSKAMQVTLSRNAKTLSPSHVKQCILAESRFDFLKDLVKSIPDVSAAEEKELMSAESSPNSSRFSDTSCPPRKVIREDSSSSSSSDVRTQSTRIANDDLTSKPNSNKPETITSSALAIDLTKKLTEDPVGKIVTANFYQETLFTDDANVNDIKPSVIQLNPTYTTSQPSTSTTLPLMTQNNSLPIQNVPLNNVPLLSVPKSMKQPVFHIDLSTISNTVKPQTQPLINIDFSKNFAQPEIRVLDTPLPNLVPLNVQANSHLQRQISVTEAKDVGSKVSTLDDNFNSGNLEIDEDYDT